MASIAHAEHPSQHYQVVRAELAAQTYHHTMFTIGLVGRLVRRVTDTLQRWTAAHRQTVQDRMFWELALTDPRVMSEIRAIKIHAERTGAAEAN